MTVADKPDRCPQEYCAGVKWRGNTLVCGRFRAGECEVVTTPEYLGWKATGHLGSEYQGDFPCDWCATPATMTFTIEPAQFKNRVMTKRAKITYLCPDHARKFAARDEAPLGTGRRSKKTEGQTSIYEEDGIVRPWGT